MGSGKKGPTGGRGQEGPAQSPLHTRASSPQWAEMASGAVVLHMYACEARVRGPRLLSGSQAKPFADHRAGEDVQLPGSHLSAPQATLPTSIGGARTGRV